MTSTHLSPETIEMLASVAQLLRRTAHLAFEPGAGASALPRYLAGLGAQEAAACVSALLPTGMTPDLDQLERLGRDPVEPVEPVELVGAAQDLLATIPPAALPAGGAELVGKVGQLARDLRSW